MSDWEVVDLFSGAGGASYGFAAHPGFRIAGAADAQIGKPSAGAGTLGCNASYARNLAVSPLPADLASADPAELRAALRLRRDPDVLIACPPCTGFSRTLARNHLVDDARNSLVRRVADYAAVLRPQVIVLENARELVMGRFSGHLVALEAALARQGFEVGATTHLLSAMGLPQRRERAVVVAVRRGLALRGLADVWSGLRVAPEAACVRRAIGGLPALAAGQRDPADPMHVSPRFASGVSLRRLAATPHDGGSWADLARRAETAALLTAGMRRRAARGEFGSHPDVYGRMWWDRPAPTIKRECGHVGNGRYAHPEQDRLCTVREMATLNGFPAGYAFAGDSLANLYRHVGDAVPPLISYQLARLTEWIFTGRRPAPGELVLPGTQLHAGDLHHVARAAA